MTPEVRQQIGEWGNVFEAVKNGGVFKNGTMYKFEGLFTFEHWYTASGYGGDADYVESIAEDMIRANNMASFFHFITSLQETHTTPSERNN